MIVGTCVFCGLLAWPPAPRRAAVAGVHPSMPVRPRLSKIRLQLVGSIEEDAAWGSGKRDCTHTAPHGSVGWRAQRRLFLATKRLAPPDADVCGDRDCAALRYAPVRLPAARGSVVASGGQLRCGDPWCDTRSGIQVEHRAIRAWSGRRSGFAPGQSTLGSMRRPVCPYLLHPGVIARLSGSCPLDFS